jgi:hypothetical protein
MREHRHSFEMPHSAARIWALMKDSALCFSVAPGLDRWDEYSPMVLEMKILEPGDEDGNELVRLLQFKLPFGRLGSARERLTDVVPERGYTFHMGTQTGTVRLVPLGRYKTRLDFVERFHLTKAPRKWFEGPIYRFINRKNEASMRGFSQWLTDHPEYHPEDYLADRLEHAESEARQ